MLSSAMYSDYLKLIPKIDNLAKYDFKVLLSPFHTVISKHEKKLQTVLVGKFIELL